MKVTEKSISIPGYKLIRADRNTKGGGVITYIRNSIKINILDEIMNKYIASGLEVIIVEIKSGKNVKSLILIGVYRPPNAKREWWTQFNELIVEISNKGSIIILGDMNADLMKPDMGTTKSLLNTCALAKVIITKIEPTRVTKNSATCIDLIGIDEEIECIEYQVDELAASDHFPVTAMIKTMWEKEKIEPIIKRSYKDLNYKVLEEKVEKIVLDSTNTTDQLLENWQKSFNDILDEEAPYKQFPFRQHRNPWIDEEIRENMKRRDQLARKQKKGDRSEETNMDLRIAKKKVKSQLRRVMQYKGMEALNSKNPKESWEYIKKVTFATKGGESSQIDLANVNEYFAKVVTATTEQPLIWPIGCDQEEGFQFQELAVWQVEKYLQTIKNNTAMGHDEIPGWLLKKLSTALAPNLTMIFNRSFEQSYFPKIWKKANVTAIWKGKGKRSDPVNYRPISILPVLARVFEKIAARQLSRYCEEHEIIPKQQFGFRRNSSCEIALIAAMDSWLESIDQGKLVGTLLIDLSKAFDMVPHQLLLNELSSIGCTVRTGLWFKSYLEDRKQRVKDQKQTTPWKKISRSVPQGGGLSPNLFNIFVRKLKAETETIQFADDITHYEADTSLQNITDKLQKAFMTTKKFCEEHELIINTEKTQLIVFKAPRKKIPLDFAIDVNNVKIRAEKNVKLLGVILDQHLTLKDQIESVTRKCHSGMGMLARAAPCLPKQMLKMIYTALIRSQMEYASSLYITIAKTHCKALDTIQKMSARIICRAPRNAHAAPLIERLQLDTLENRRKKHVNGIVEAIIAKKCHPVVRDMFELTENNFLEIKPTLTGHGKKRFCVAAANIYNEQNGNKTKQTSVN